MTPKDLVCTHFWGASIGDILRIQIWKTSPRWAGEILPCPACRPFPTESSLLHSYPYWQGLTVFLKMSPISSGMGPPWKKVALCQSVGETSLYSLVPSARWYFLMLLQFGVDWVLTVGMMNVASRNRLWKPPCGSAQLHTPLFPTC